jgi:four helix bundle protein
MNLAAETVFMEPYLFSFEKLTVWQLARQLAVDIYKRTVSFPVAEKYSLVSQIRRSAISVAANIAEGSSRTGARDQAKFTTNAFSSLMELLNHLVIASDLEYMDTKELVNYRERIQTLSVKLSNLKSSQLKKTGSGFPKTT